MEDNTARRSRRTIIGLIIVFVLFVICAVGLFLIFRPQSEDEPTPTFTPVPVEAEVDVWEQIQARGTLVVGMAADYPPFEYYDENFQLNGLDVAIVKDIGQRLGLEVEIRDMAFDGLGNALQVDQIDAAISAISATDERRRFVDFSNVYFVSSDAVLANADSQIDAITRPDEVALLKIGVESGTVYDNWVQTNLVESGLMPANNAHTYRKIDDAIEDLSAGRIDLVALDLQPAQLAESRGDVKIVAQDLTPQEFAIAVPKGANQLLAQLNQALFEMQGDGTLRSLTAEYIGLDEESIPPLPEPEPTPDAPLTELSPAFCIDSAEFIEHLSLDHQDFEGIPEMTPGEPFQKGWRMLNTGTCTWGVGYALIPVDGNDPAFRMGALPIEVRDQVQPGQTYDFWADLVAPIEPGTYVGHWSMRNGQSGLLFGDRVSVAVEVIAAPTPTPAPTQTPVPGISFSANPEVIQQGQCSTLTWNTQNVDSVYLYEQGEDWSAHGVPGDGTLSVCPLSTTTYELRVVLNDGTVEIRRVTVFVTPNPAVPQITRFTVDPPDQIALSQCVTIQWIVEGQVNTVNIFRNNVVIWPNAPVSGAMQDCPSNTGQQIYSLEATGSGGTSRAQWVINVVQSSGPVPTSTPTAAPMTPTPSNMPVIYYFTLSPQEIRVNQCVTLSWSVGGNATRVSILKNSVTVQENLAFHSSWNDCSNSNVGTVIYILTAASDFNQTDAEQRPVNVLP